MPVLLTIDPANPEGAALAEAVRILREGGVLAYPTETFYGLGADARCEAAVEKIFAIKGRDFRNPVAVIVHDALGVPPLVAEIPGTARILMRRFWPGPLTLVFSASPSVSARLTGGTGKIGIRVSSHPVALALARGLDGPLTATSANRSGGPEGTTAREALLSLGERPDAFIDSGATPGGAGSTILDVTAAPPRLLREGAVPAAEILAALQ